MEAPEVARFGRRLSVAILVAIQAATLLPFRFTTEFGERDSYRMLLGLLDTFAHRAPFNSPLLYNREVSFGYYGLFYVLAPLLGNGPQALTAAMNWLAVFSVILFVIPAYLVVERLLGRQVAIASMLILAATPVWWYCGLYGHPITTALLLFFTGLAILCRYDRAPAMGVRLTVLGLFAAALTIRFDTVLLFVALVAVLWACRKVFDASVAKEASLYALGSMALFEIAQRCLPRVSRGQELPSISTLLATFHAPSHYISGLRDSVIALGQGFTGVLLVAIPVSAWILFRKRDYPALLFVSGAIALNLVFWLPNPSPARHYLMMAPAIGASAALVALTLVSWLRVRLPSPAWFAGLAVAIAIVGASAGLHRYGTGRLSYFRSPFAKPAEWKVETDRAERIAAALVDLPPLSTPVVVLCDANLVIAEMEKLDESSWRGRTAGGAGPRFAATSMARQEIPGYIAIERGSNRFIMLEQAWSEDAVRALDQPGVYPGLPVLVAPYLSNIPYQGLRPRLLAPAWVEGPAGHAGH